MPRDLKKRKNRDKKVRLLFTNISNKNPKWKINAIIEKVAEDFFLSPKTVEDIIKGYGIYNY